MTLEEQIRDAAKRGELNHLSLTCGGKDGLTFTASFAPASTFGIHFKSDTDPVKALQAALSEAKMKRLPKQKEPSERPNAEPPANDLDFG